MIVAREAKKAQAVTVECTDGGLADQRGAEVKATFPRKQQTQQALTSRALRRPVTIPGLGPATPGRLPPRGQPRLLALHDRGCGRPTGN